MDDEKKIELSLPGFCGFYESNLSAGIDSHEQSETYYFANERERDDGTTGSPLTEDDYFNLFAKHADYSKARISIAEAYAEKADEVLRQLLGEDDDSEPRITFARVVSPREYNFRTDELCVFVRPDLWAQMMSEVRPEDMDRIAAARHTSRSGFISFYSSDWRSWGDVADYDDVQRDTLFRAWLEKHRDAIYELADSSWVRAHDTEDTTAGELFGRYVEDLLIGDGEVFANAWSECMDWAAFDSAEAEMIAEMKAAPEPQ